VCVCIVVKEQSSTAVAITICGISTAGPRDKYGDDAAPTITGGRSKYTPLSLSDTKYDIYNYACSILSLEYLATRCYESFWYGYAAAAATDDDGAAVHGPANVYAATKPHATATGICQTKRINRTICNSAFMIPTTHSFSSFLLFFVVKVNAEQQATHMGSALKSSVETGQKEGSHTETETETETEKAEKAEGVAEVDDELQAMLEEAWNAEGVQGSPEEVRQFWEGMLERGEQGQVGGWVRSVQQVALRVGRQI
jgi:hypothetical protein